MSNVKAVEITGVIPFCWMDEMNKEDAATLGHTFLSPTIGIHLSFGREVGMVPNDHGGKTAMYEFTVVGTEAISYSFFDKLVEIFKKYGEVKHTSIIDLEA